MGSKNAEFRLVSSKTTKKNYFKGIEILVQVKWTKKAWTLFITSSTKKLKSKTSHFWNRKYKSDRIFWF